MVYVIQVCWQLASRISTSVLIQLASCQQNCTTYTIAMCTWKTADDGRRNCPKHVEFYSKIKFEKIRHLVCFNITLNHFSYILSVLVPFVDLPDAWARHRTNRSSFNPICQQFGQCQVVTLRRLVRCCYRRTQISHTCAPPPSTHLFWQ